MSVLSGGIKGILSGGPAVSSSSQQSSSSAPSQTIATERIYRVDTERVELVYDSSGKVKGITKPSGAPVQVSRSEIAQPPQEITGEKQQEITGKVRTTVTRAYLQEHPEYWSQIKKDTGQPYTAHAKYAYTESGKFVPIDPYAKVETWTGPAEGVEPEPQPTAYDRRFKYEEGYVINLDTGKKTYRPQYEGRFDKGATYKSAGGQVFYISDRPSAKLSSSVYYQEVPSEPTFAKPAGAGEYFIWVEPRKTSVADAPGGMKLVTYKGGVGGQETFQILETPSGEAVEGTIYKSKPQAQYIYSEGGYREVPQGPPVLESGVLRKPGKVIQREETVYESPAAGVAAARSQSQSAAILFKPRAEPGYAFTIAGKTDYDRYIRSTAAAEEQKRIEGEHITPISMAADIKEYGVGFAFERKSRFSKRAFYTFGEAEKGHPETLAGEIGITFGSVALPIIAAGTPVAAAIGGAAGGGLEAGSQILGGRPLDMGRVQAAAVTGAAVTPLFVAAPYSGTIAGSIIGGGAAGAGFATGMAVSEQRVVTPEEIREGIKTGAVIGGAFHVAGFAWSEGRPAVSKAIGTATGKDIPLKYTRTIERPLEQGGPSKVYSVEAKGKGLPEGFEFVEAPSVRTTYKTLKASEGTEIVGSHVTISPEFSKSLKSGKEFALVGQPSGAGGLRSQIESYGFYSSRPSPTAPGTTRAYLHYAGITRHPEYIYRPSEFFKSIFKPSAKPTIVYEKAMFKTPESVTRAARKGDVITGSREAAYEQARIGSPLFQAAPEDIRYYKSAQPTMESQVVQPTKFTARTGEEFYGVITKGEYKGKVFYRQGDETNLLQRFWRPQKTYEIEIFEKKTRAPTKEEIKAYSVAAKEMPKPAAQPQLKRVAIPREYKQYYGVREAAYEAKPPAYKSYGYKGYAPPKYPESYYASEYSGKAYAPLYAGGYPSAGYAPTRYSKNEYEPSPYPTSYPSAGYGPTPYPGGYGSQYPAPKPTEYYAPQPESKDIIPPPKIPPIPFVMIVDKGEKEPMKKRHNENLRDVLGYVAPGSIYRSPKTGVKRKKKKKFNPSMRSALGFISGDIK